MSHPEQRQFCRWVKRKYPEYFRRKTVIDVGSLDINGNNRRWFSRCDYTGIDIVQGRNVDLVGLAHVLLPEICSVRRPAGWKPDTIICTEMLEHDRYWKESLQKMYDVLNPGGMLLITAAGEGRVEHGTRFIKPEDSPGTLDYYQNITNEMFLSVLTPDLFSVYYIAQGPEAADFNFFGIKPKPNYMQEKLTCYDDPDYIPEKWV